MIRLVTHATRNYLPKMRPYLASLQANCPWPVTLLTVDCVAPIEFMEQYPKVETVWVPRADGSPDPTQSLQHGAFACHLPGADTDVLIYTDGDMTLQRQPTAAEIRLIANLGPRDVVAGFNSGPDETLALEATRLYPRQSPAELAADWDVTHPCYNVGVIAMRRATWTKVHAVYMQYWERVCAAFGDAARQQWLICWALGELGLTVEVPGYGFHANGHYGVPPGVSVNGTANYNGEPVLFRHRI